MSDHLVVDGYNIIHAWPELEKLAESSLEHARTRLVDILVNYAALSGERVVVVFDAHQVKNAVERAEMVQGVQVIFTAEGETADSVIERLVGELARQGTVHVVTYDWAEQQTILGRGAYRLTPRELWQRVIRFEQEGRKHYQNSRPADSYLENRLVEEIRAIFERWRRKKD
ncbi:NYN domain-containing protein [Desulfofundulus thermobenzoicus]|uniref:NYN domain-containing protein n=1 Tax=Desulfofundulus thermobenzoicus TaxID=29376 RepID=A0A6N7IPK3_9FIRM|nr:NYN domain-containing protein [Desulfofundulus thermobenzoicus]MQL51966.1 NYN domain-containing protein [Desulfofundulus thermobenzoicus]HHW43734.1 NYN domain-containing protein [Desulfotomaculum sp.]